MQMQYLDHHAPAPATQPTAAATALPYTPLPKRRGTGPTVALVAIALVIPAMIFGLHSVA